MGVGATRRPRLLGGAAAIGCGISAGLCFPYTVDDAYITARIASNLAHGEGYVMNAGNAAADGVTGPLWIAPGLVASRLGLDPVLAAKLMGALCILAAVILAMRAVSTRAGGRIAGPVLAFALASQPTLASWAVGGLETGAATLALCVVAFAAAGRLRPTTAIVSIAAAAVPWLRPELVPAAAVAAVLLWRVDARRGQAALLSIAGALVAVVLFRLLVFGHALPLSVEAKPATLGNGLEYLARCVAVTTGVGGLGLVAVAVRHGQRRDRALAWIVATHLLAIVIAGGDWMPGFRLLTPVVPAYWVLAAVGFARLVRQPARAQRVLAGCLLLPALAIPVADLALRVDGAAQTAHSRRTVGRSLATELRKRCSRVAMVDVGFLAFHSGVDVIDLGGVTDAEIARLAGGHLDKRIEAPLLRARAPDGILLHARRPPSVDDEGRLQTLDGWPVERRVASLEWVARRFRVARVDAYAPDYHYVLLLPRQ